MLKKSDVTDAIGMALLYPVSYFRSFRMRRTLRGISTYCMFIGYPRSGHSLIGSLLDAHPEIIVAQELGVLKYLLAGFGKRQIYYLLIRNSRRFTEAGRNWSTYTYGVENQWQGKYRRLRVVGDKQGGGAILRLKARPWLYDRLEKTMDDGIKFFHVVRNPYDNISTIARKHGFTLAQGVEFYFSLCETVQKYREKIPRENLLEVRHEAFVRSPKAGLGNMCAFLKVVPTEAYLNDCADIVFDSPRKTRHAGLWNRDMINAVTSKMEGFPFLEGYSFED